MYKGLFILERMVVMKNVQGFSKLLKNAGLEIQSMKCMKEYGRHCKEFDVVLKNGQKGVYSIWGDSNGLTQELVADGKYVIGGYKKDLKVSQRVGLYNDVHKRTFAGYVRDVNNKKDIYATSETYTPLTPVVEKLVDGSTRTKVPMLKELHSDTFVKGSDVVIPTDRLVGGQGECLPVFNREPYFSDRGVNRRALFLINA